MQPGNNDLKFFENEASSDELASAPGEHVYTGKALLFIALFNLSGQKADKTEKPSCRNESGP